MKMFSAVFFSTAESGAESDLICRSIPAILGEPEFC
jgi:hypothetical protein